MKEIICNNIIFKFSIEDLINKLEKYQWEEPYGVCYGDNDDNWMSKTQEEFDVLKENFKQKLLELDKTAENLIINKVKFTKAGLPHKGRRHLLLESEIITSYSDEHGSHAYNVVCLFPKFISEKEVILDLNTFSFQSSF